MLCVMGNGIKLNESRLLLLEVIAQDDIVSVHWISQQLIHTYADESMQWNHELTKPFVIVQESV